VADEATNATPQEEKAKLSGWVPESEWQGDPSDWVDAHHFNIRGELMDRISSQTRQIKDSQKKNALLEAAVRELGEHNKRIADIQYKRAVESLKAQKVEALRAGDTEGVVSIDDNIQELKEARAAVEKTTVLPEAAPETAPPELVSAFQTWIADPANDWYSKDAVLRGAANAIGDQMLTEGTDPSLLFKAMSKKIKEEFPHKFGGSKKLPSAVDDTPEGTTTDIKRIRSKYSVKDLTEGERDIGKKFVELNVFKNMQEYVDQFAAGGGFQGDRMP
jgi:hypothetical protein